MNIEFILDKILYFIPLILILTCSGVFLLLQAFFYDKRIAIVGLIGLISSRAALILPDSISNIIILLALLINITFLFVFLFKCYKKKLVFVPVILILISSGVIVWLYSCGQG